MAEPVDYFFQGANLGMNAAQFGARQRQDDYQFRTNLAERARQFNLENEIRRDTLELNRDQYSMDLEKHQLAQKASKLAIRNARMDVERQQRELEEDEKWAPAVEEFSANLDAAGPLDQMPYLPPGMPLRIRQQLTEAAKQHFVMLKDTMGYQQAVDRRERIRTRTLGTIKWLEENGGSHLLKEDINNPGMLTYDTNAYLAFRSEKEKAESELARRKIESEINKNNRTGSASTGRAASEKRDWMASSATKAPYLKTIPQTDPRAEPEQIVDWQALERDADRLFGPDPNRPPIPSIFGNTGVPATSGNAPSYDISDPTAFTGEPWKNEAERNDFINGLTNRNGKK